MRRFFAEPDALVYGDETAEQARARFQGGIDQILADAAPEENIAVIAHGTVIALYAAHYNHLRGLRSMATLGHAPPCLSSICRICA